MREWVMWAQRREGSGYIGQDEQSQLPGVLAEVLNECRRVCAAGVREAVLEVARFDSQSWDAHVPLKLGENGRSGGFKVYQQVLWHASHQKMGCNSPPREYGWALVTHLQWIEWGLCWLWSLCYKRQCNFHQTVFFVGVLTLEAFMQCNPVWKDCIN